MSDGRCFMCLIGVVFRCFSVLFMRLLPDLCVFSVSSDKYRVDIRMAYKKLLPETNIVGAFLFQAHLCKGALCIHKCAVFAIFFV